jgi:PAS domain S-box-containing protein
MRESLKAFLNRWGFSAGILCLVGIAIGVTFSYIEFKDFGRRVHHTGEVLDQIDHFMIVIGRTEVDQRGYLITRDPNLLKSYTELALTLRDEVKKLHDLVIDSPIQVQRSNDLDDLVAIRLKHFQSTVELAPKIALGKLKDIVDTKTTPKIRAIAREMSDEENRLLSLREASSNLSLDFFLRLMTVGALFSIALIFGSRRIQKNSAKALAEQSNLLHAVFESMGDGLWVVDRNGNCTHSNSAVERLMGVKMAGVSTENRLRTGSTVDLRTGEKLKHEDSPIVRSLRGESVDGFEVSTTLNQSKIRILSVDSRPVIDKDGHVIGALALSRDVTDRKEIEKEWMAAREAAVEASRLKSDFLATMSHEIRTPMNGVLGMTTLLLETTLEKEQLSFVKTIKSSADSLLTLINQILDHSKIEAGKIELESKEFDLRQCLDDVLGVFRQQARSKALQLEVDIDASLPRFVIGDSARLRQILINLVGNALKFTEKGSVKILVAPQASSDGDNKVHFSVKDTGPGISENSKVLLFEKFSQVHKGDGEKYGGSGLGLMISRELARLMGGDIGMNSEIGMGSEFWFTAKLGKSNRIADAPISIVRNRPKFKGSVLVAEDQVVNQIVVRKFLQMFGLECQIVAEGGAAISAVKERDYDLILMDCQMKPVDGYEATMQIREFEKASGRHTPIVALTAEGRSGDKSRCFASGMDGFLTKPIEVDRLKEALEMWLKKSTTKEFEVSVVEKLMEFSTDDGPLGLLLIAEYKRESAVLIEKLKLAALTENETAMSECAHALKSSSLMLGLKHLGEICQSMESNPSVEQMEGLVQSWEKGLGLLSEYAITAKNKVI